MNRARLPRYICPPCGEWLTLGIIPKTSALAEFETVGELSTSSPFRTLLAESYFLLTFTLPAELRELGRPDNISAHSTPCLFECAWATVVGSYPPSMAQAVCRLHSDFGTRFKKLAQLLRQIFGLQMCAPLEHFLGGGICLVTADTSESRDEPQIYCKLTRDNLHKFWNVQYLCENACSSMFVKFQTGRNGEKNIGTIWEKSGNNGK